MTDKEDMIVQIMGVHRRMREHFAGAGSHPILELHLTMRQLQALSILRRSGATAGKDLASAMRISLATVTGIADRLVAQGLISRREDPRDRRVRLLELTAAGTALLDRLAEAEETELYAVLGRLDVDDLRVVARAFEIMASVKVTGGCADEADPATGPGAPSSP